MKRTNLNNHRYWVGLLGVLVIVLLIISSPANALTIPLNDDDNIIFGDMTTFNYRYLVKKGVLSEVPATPTGTSDELIRMFTNGNTNTLIPTVTEPVEWPPVGFGDLGDTDNPVDWWGLEFDSGGNATKALTVANLLTGIQTIPGNTNAVNPIFAFDQNQEGGDPDILLKGRFILVKKSELEFKLVTTVLGSTLAEIKTAVDNVGDNDKQILLFFDSGTTIPVIDDGKAADARFPGSADGGFVLLPGIFDPDPLDAFDPVNNNIGGNKADWGGYFPGLDLSDAKYDGWLAFVELNSLANNNGKEEAYIIGGVVIPVPLAFWAGLVLMGGVVGISNHRRTKHV